MQSLDELSAFLAVAETQSFSEAARRLRLTTAGVSKAVARLERSLAVRLFTRTTRRVAATPEGLRLLPHARELLARADDARQALQAAHQAPSGHVRLAAPVLLGQQRLLPMLSTLRQQLPGLAFELSLSDQFVDLAGGGFDLALRFGELADSGLVARPLARSRFITCASPAYLARHGRPARIADLAGHACVAYAVQTSGRVFDWRFSRGRMHTPHSDLLVVNDGGANLAAALAGIGLIQDIDLALAPELAAGRLEAVLVDEATAGPPLALVRPGGRYLPERVRRVEQALRDAFAQD